MIAPTRDLEAIQAEADRNSPRRAAPRRRNCVEDAAVQAEALREAAWQEGFHSGKSEAHSVVEAEMRQRVGRAPETLCGRN